MVEGVGSGDDARVRTRLERARMLLFRSQPRDAEQARQLLGQAVGSAQTFGLANIARQARTLLTQGT